jgi:hypothetical protein
MQCSPFYEPRLSNGLYEIEGQGHGKESVRTMTTGLWVDSGPGPMTHLQSSSDYTCNEQLIDGRFIPDLVDPSCPLTRGFSYPTCVIPPSIAVSRRTRRSASPGSSRSSCGEGESTSLFVARQVKWGLEWPLHDSVRVMVFSVYCRYAKLWSRLEDYM